MIMVKTRKDDQEEPWLGHPWAWVQIPVQLSTLSGWPYTSRVLSGPLFSHL